MRVIAGLLFASTLAYEQEWQEWQQKNGFQNGPIPEAFMHTVDVVKAHNAKESSYKLTYTGPFATMTQEEFKQRQGLLTGGVKTELPHHGVHRSVGFAPDAVDWTTKGVVTPVKNQGQCGSCWAFSVTGTTEGQWALATGNLVSLSEQFFVDCATNGDQGCSGGFMDRTLDWASDQWIPTEESYPYNAVKRHCIKGGWEVAISKGQVSGFKEVLGEDDLLDAVANVGPISIGIEADQAAFQHYDSGVIDDGCGSQIDHGVLAVGFGTMDGKNYWKVKNSWGDQWGSDGFVYLARGKQICGIGTNASYPLVDPTVAPTPAPPAPPPTPPPAPCTFGDDAFSKTCLLTCFNWCYNNHKGAGQCQETDTHLICNCDNGDYCEADKNITTTLPTTTSPTAFTV
jgi:C1A family cysteine protease